MLTYSAATKVRTLNIYNFETVRECCSSTLLFPIKLNSTSIYCQFLITKLDFFFSFQQFFNFKLFSPILLIFYYTH